MMTDHQVRGAKRRSVSTTGRASVPGGRARNELRTGFLTRCALIYVHLWILEGAIRKWVPGADEVMYVARDGFLLLVIVYATLRYPARGHKRGDGVLVAAVALFCVWTLSAALLSGLPLAALIAGIRAYLAPFLLVYLVWRYRLSGFYMRAARVVLLYAPLQATLVVVQVLSPLSSPINAYAGGVEGTFVTTDGVARATGTFTFAAGLTTYATIALALSVGSILSRRPPVSPTWGYLSLISSVVVVAISGSRSLVLTAILVTAILIAAQAFHGSPLGWRRLFVSVALGWGAWLVLQQTLGPVLAAFGDRFEAAAQAEDPIQRQLSGVFGFMSEGIVRLGDGAGAHSQAGAQLGSSFGWSENEKTRWVEELGLLGFVLGLVSVVLASILLVWVVVARHVDVVARALAAAFLVQVAFGSVTATPTVQGAFAVLAAALVSWSSDKRRCPP